MPSPVHQTLAYHLKRIEQYKIDIETWPDPYNIYNEMAAEVATAVTWLATEYFGLQHKERLTLGELIPSIIRNWSQSARVTLYFPIQDESVSHAARDHLSEDVKMVRSLRASLPSDLCAKVDEFSRKIDHCGKYTDK